MGGLKEEKIMLMDEIFIPTKMVGWATRPKIIVLVLLRGCVLTVGKKAIIYKHVNYL